MATIKELEESVKKLNKEIEERVKKLHDDLVELKAKQNSGHWVPEQGGIYYYIDSDLSVSPTYNYNHRYDKNRILVGNCYKTLAEAEKERDRLIAIAEVNQIIREENGGEVPDWNDCDQQKWLLCYDYSNNSLEATLSIQRKIPSELDFCCGGALKKIMSRITQDQINKIWRL